MLFEKLCNKAVFELIFPSLMNGHRKQTYVYWQWVFEWSSYFLFSIEVKVNMNLHPNPS